MNLSRYGGSVLAAIYLFYIIDLTINYRNNPKGFLEDLIKKDTLSLALPVAGLSYLIGGATASHLVGNFLNLSRKNLANLSMAGKIFHNNPTLANQIAGSSMVGLSRTAEFLKKAFTPMGIIAGVPIAKMAYVAVHGLHACIKSKNHTGDKEIDAINLRKACKKSWDDFAGVLTDTETWLTVTSLLTAHAIISFFMNKANLGRFASFKKASERLPTLNKWSKVPHMAKNIVLTLRGIARPSLVFVVHFAVFTVVFYMAFELFKHAAGKIMNEHPVKVTAEQYRRLMREYHLDPNNLEQICDNEELIDIGNFWTNLFHYWGNEHKKDVSCGLNLFNTYIEHYNKVNAKWRTEKMKPFDQAVMNWSSFLHKALSTYHSGHLFYKDVVEQIRVAKKNGLELDFSYAEVSGIKVPSSVEQAKYYNSPLPLFRSDPMFGWNYRLDPESPTIAYPDHRSFSVDWDAEYVDKSITESLTKRFEGFKTKIVPVLVESLKAINTLLWVKVKKMLLRLI